MKRILLVCVLFGCSKGDDCQKLVDKMMPIMKEMAGKDGKDIDKGKDKFLEQCRKDDKMKNDPMMKCVLDASGDDAVKACLSKSLGDYEKKAKSSEAPLMLNTIAKKAKIAAAEKSAFPTGTAKELPAAPGPGPGCCGTADGKCAVSADWANDPVWKALDFSIDQPTMYRYKYESADGKSFTATATGDTDCDGDAAVFTVKGTLDASGNATTELMVPPKGKF
jgi:hypothetical protein